jgi:hypothetical protein
MLSQAGGGRMVFLLESVPPTRSLVGGGHTDSRLESALRMLIQAGGGHMVFPQASVKNEFDNYLFHMPLT